MTLMSTKQRPPVIDANGSGRFWLRFIFLVLGFGFAVLELRHFAAAIGHHLRRLRR
jgi:hypothetical protein